MTAYEDVLRWAEDRPWWQQKVLARIAGGEAIAEREHVEIARSLLEEPESPPNGGWFTQLEPPQATRDESVRILAVRGLKNVNRLAEDQKLTFAPEGLTVVFGNNGSGKSGYARVIQSMVRARHRVDILPDVFAETTEPQSGELVYSVGATPCTVSLGQSPNPDISRVAFYDEHCGDTYLTAEAEISYQPSAVRLLKDLATVCGGVRRVINDWKLEASQPCLLPEVDENGSAQVFLRSLKGSTSDEELAAATACPSDVDERLRTQVQEVARLRATDPAKEERRLTKLANAYAMVANHLVGIDNVIGADAQQDLDELVKNAAATQEAAEAASRSMFAEEPLSAVGTGIWKKLWYAAEQYSKVVYHDQSFPHTADGALCVLCHQALDADAVDRFERFRQFMTDTTAQEAEDAQRRLANFRSDIDELMIQTPQLSSEIAILEQNEESIVRSLQSILEAMQARKSALLKGEESKPVSVVTEVNALRQKAAYCQQLANGVDANGFANKLTVAEAREWCLRDQIAMRDGHHLIEEERARLRRVAALDEKLAETNTGAITKKVGELIRTYVTDEACNHFIDEANLFGIKGVTFKATRARQGTQLHKADFLNARRDSKLQDVLSEGEQTALGFAGFLTEVYFDTSKSALVLDDPVSSLDHMKRESVARRIVKLAKERQVVVFTHDVAFTMLLHKVAGEYEVPCCARGIEQKRQVGPGYVTQDHPWRAKGAAQRVDALWHEVASLRHEEKGMSEEEYQRETEKIAGHMSQTWERIISQVLAEPLLDYFSLEVRVGKLRVVGRVTDEDVKIYDDSYSRISAWASRHDPHAELNFTPPTIEQLKDEIKVIADWLNKVKKYQSS